MPANPVTTATIETTVPIELAERLRASAAAADRSVAAEARRAIRIYLTTSEVAGISGDSAATAGAGGGHAER